MAPVWPRQPDEFYLRLRAAFENRLEGCSRAQLLAAHGAVIVSALESFDSPDLLEYLVPETTKKNPTRERGANKVVCIRKSKKLTA